MHVWLNSNVVDAVTLSPPFRASDYHHVWRTLEEARRQDAQTVPCHGEPQPTRVLPAVATFVATRWQRGLLAGATPGRDGTRHRPTQGTCGTGYGTHFGVMSSSYYSSSCCVHFIDVRRHVPPLSTVVHLISRQIVFK